MILSEDVDAFARLMVSAYRSAAADARAFTNEWGLPPTRMDRSHRFRSIVQAQVSQSDRYHLHPEFMEAGRVQVTDRKARNSFLIRSRSAMNIEAALSRDPEQLVLFEGLRPRTTNLPEMLAYNFEMYGMRLWACATKRIGDRQRLAPDGSLELVGFWRFDSVPPGDGGGGVFDQGAEDPWSDLGDLDMGEAEDM